MNYLRDLLRNYLLLFKVVILLTLLGTISILYNKYENATKVIKSFQNNELAIKAQKDSLLNNNIVFKHTIEELRDSNDSINKVLTDTYTKLKIKDREVNSLSYLKSQVSKVDTIILKDTVFLTNTSIDTLIQDRWYSLSLKLEYPNRVTINPSFISEKVIITNKKKVWLKKPKWWVCRLFKKKDTIIEVTVVDNNPYIKEEEHKHIEIIK